MSDLRVRRLEIKAFKAFQQLDLDLNGRDLLAYGPNGSGKSSLYWAFYTFLQSAQKESSDVTKYFDKSRPENLVNLRSPESDTAAITVTLQNADASTCTNYTLSSSQHGTKENPDILKGNLASDFINYRILFSFYHFRNSQALDLWPVFEHEMLPFCRGVSITDVAGHWKQILSAMPYERGRAEGRRGTAFSKSYDEFDDKVAALNTALTEILDTITREAQAFYDMHFAEFTGPKIEFRVGLTGNASKYDRKKHSYTPPVVGFEIRIDGNVIHKPQSFLNEAKLTQFALSVRLGATLAHLQESPLKLLVLDDLLISLDMSNRMKVVDIILGKSFAEYQKIILTHDLGFFREIRRRIGNKHADWSFQRFQGKPTTGAVLALDKSELEKAEDYIHGQNLDEAAVCLRKAAEDTALRFRAWAENKQLPPGKFYSLTENLRAARNSLVKDIPIGLYERVLKAVPEACRDLLVPDNTIDLDAIVTLTAADRGILTSQRRKLRTLIKSEHWKKLENAKIIDEVIATTARVLNAGAHQGESPLYEAEVENALELIKRLEVCLADSLSGK